MPPHTPTPTPVYMHKCIHTVLVNILQYVNEYTQCTNLVWLGGEGKGWEGRRGRGKHGKRKGWGGGDRGIKVSSDVVNLQEATALGHMQGC